MHNDITAGFRLSPQQQQVWGSQLEAPACCAQCAVAIEGRLDKQALAKALEQVVVRHEILRTTFHRPAGMRFPLQVIGEARPVALEESEVRSSGPEALKAALDTLWEKERMRPFDFEHGPLLRAALASQSPDRHVLVLTLPALVADGQTLQNLVAELSRFYGKGASDGEAAEQPLQYADFSQWQNELAEATGEDAETGRAFWQQLAPSAAPALVLPFQARGTTTGTFEPGRVVVPIASEVIAKVEALTRDLGVTVPTFLLACWQTLIWRLTGQEDFVLENVFDARTYDETQGALGLFARVLPIRCHVEDLPFVEVVRYTAKSLDPACQWHEYLPAATARATVAFAFENARARYSVGAAAFSIRRLSCNLQPVALQLTCVLAEDSTAAEFSYDTRLFQGADVQRIAGYFERLLEQVLLQSRTPISALTLLSEKERQQLLVGFNQTAWDYPRDKCIHHLFEDQVARTPERPALAFADQQWSYAELNSRANQLAHNLRKRGVRPGVVVGLCLERCGEMVIGLLGILKAGGAFLPLPPEHPKGRLAYQLTEARSPVLVTQEKFLDPLSEFSGTIVCLDRDGALLEGEPTTNPERANQPQDLAYVIYTSGSTGVPKGVAVRQQNLVNYAHFICQRLRLAEAPNGAGFHFATVSTISADLGNTCIYPALISGGCLHVVGYETSMDSSRFGDYVSRHPIDVLKITPSHLSALLATPEGRRVLPTKYLIFGGEASSWDLIQRVRQAGTCAVINHYGPTETTVGSLTFSLEDSEAARSRAATVPIGRPIANTEVYLLDPSRKPVPIGVAGELYIGGAGVTAGYLNQPEQTAERFIPDTFSGRREAKLYRTGDRGRWLPDGTVEFLGRVDHQVKIRGFRLEPAEIEAVLCRHAGIRQAIVIPREEDDGNKRLVAYCVPVNGRWAEAEIRSFLAQHLPDYMVPAVFVALDALPLTPNGKVDRRALPDPATVGTQPTRAFVGARNPIEAGLVQIWSEILGADHVGVEDDFFELGGHSLLATQVVSRIRAAFQVELPLRAMFETPTVAGLAGTIAQLRGDHGPEDEMDRMLAELEQLGEEEVERLLAVAREREEN